MYDKKECEYLRYQAKQKFDPIRSTWIDLGRWALPHRIKWLLSQREGERNNQHIVDATHVLALRSYVAGFLEGNTSASRPWFRHAHADPELNRSLENREWIDRLTRSTLNVLSQSNFYSAAGGFYYDFGVFMTGAHLIDERPDGTLYFHNLIPGQYTIINNVWGEAVIMVIDKTMTVKAMVDRYAKKKNSHWDWSNISKSVRKLYEEGNYTQIVSSVQVIMENRDFDVSKPIGGKNRKWVSIEYEVGSTGGPYYQDNIGQGGIGNVSSPDEENKFLEINYSKRKPFIVGKSDSNGGYEYGEKGPTLDCLGMIKSLNKKAIAKDQALEQMLRPALQGPASLRKSYVTSVPNSYVPLDPTSLAQKGLRPIFEVNPAIAQLLQDCSDMRGMVDKLYYADFLLFLSRNPKTRTATETNAVIQEQQLIIGPNLQSLNWTYNIPVVDYATEYALDNDPYLGPPPEALQGQALRTDFISVFAQAQKAADLPAINQYVSKMMEIAALDPRVWDKVNTDKIADLYEDRLFLPAGLNNAQSKVERERAQAQAQAQRQQALQETIPALAGAAKDVGIKAG